MTKDAKCLGSTLLPGYDSLGNNLLRRGYILSFNLSRFCSQEKFIFIVWPQGLTDALVLTLVLSCWKRAHISLKSKETVWNMWNIGFKCNMVLHYIARSRWEGNWVRTKDSFVGVTCFPEEANWKPKQKVMCGIHPLYPSLFPLNIAVALPFARQTSAHFYAFLPPSKRHRLANKYTCFQGRGGEGKRCLQVSSNAHLYHGPKHILILKHIWMKSF